jgi:uncharacterized protein (UPF0303 family)
VSLDSDIAQLARQEELLRFDRFNEDDAWALGQQMRAAAAARNLPFVIDIRIGNRPLFYAAMPGTTPENPDWVRRKTNTVMRFHKSSYRVGREYLKKGQAFDAARGLNALDYAPDGGSFPIHLAGTGVIGTVTVSGVPQREDHNFVAEMLSAFLRIDYTDIALGPETA